MCYCAVLQVSNYHKKVTHTCVAGNQLHSLLTGTVISATMALPTHVAEAVLQSHVTANLQGQAMSGKHFGTLMALLKITVVIWELKSWWSCKGPIPT